MKENILDDFKRNEKTYHSFNERVVHLLTDLLADQEIQIHQISSRIKSHESLSKKIDDKYDKYSQLNDLTDIIGIRIITYLEGDVDSISDLIRKEFVIDSENSIDKRKLKSDQFGYRSLHIIASFNEDRCNLKEYKKYKGIKCEIQIRSILQHAWAEIEHELGYKGEITIPDPYKRAFNRLSALLETADIEFDRLKSELKLYEKKVPELIIAKPNSVDINKASIKSFLYTNPILLKAKALIEDKTKVTLTGSTLNDFIIKRLKYLDFQSIGQLELSLIEDEQPYLNFVELFADRKLRKDSNVSALAPLLYFLHFLLSKKGDFIKFLEYFEVPEYSKPQLADFGEYIDLYKKSIQ